MSGADTFRRSLWHAITPPAVDLPEFAGDRRADVAVVGAGFLGLSLALELARLGATVVLLEAEEPGFGASGRNTGFVVPSFTSSLGPSDVRRLLGDEAGDRLSRFVGGSGATLFSLAAREMIECSAEPNGWLQPASTAATVELLERRASEWQALGQPVALLDRDQTMRLTGSRAFKASLLDRSGGQINPLAFARGLAAAALAAGARIFQRSRVESWARAGGAWTLRTARGTLVADQVFFTTNALVGPLAAAVAASIIPVRPYQVATEPLPQEVRARIMPERHPVADLRHHTFACRWSPDNRLVTGGLAILNTRDAATRLGRHFLDRLRRYLPDLPPLRAAFTWGGVIATTPRFLPELWQLGPGLLAPIGCNGRGVAVTTALGIALAQYAKSGDEALLPLPPHPPRPHRWPRLLEWGPSLWLAWNSLRDRLDERLDR